MFLAFVLNPPSQRHRNGTSYVLAAKVEGTKVTVSSFFMGHRQESVFTLSDGILKKGEKNDQAFFLIISIIQSMKSKDFHYITLPTETTYEKLIQWHEGYKEKNKRPAKFLQQMLWECSTKKNYFLGNNCSDEALRILRDGCGVDPKVTRRTQKVQSFFATTLCASTCACVGLCVCCGYVAPKFPIKVNTPLGAFYLLQEWAGRNQTKDSVDFIDHIYGKAECSSELVHLSIDSTKEEKSEGPGPERQVMGDSFSSQMKVVR